MVFERKYETSYDLALGFARACAQRCHVAVPSVLAIPISSLAPHREGPVVVCAWAMETIAAAAVSAYRHCEINIFGLPFVAHGASRNHAARPRNHQAQAFMMPPNAAGDKDKRRRAASPGHANIKPARIRLSIDVQAAAP
jgi:hypothetical protein